MNGGLLLKSLREVRFSTACFGCGLAVAEILLAYLPPTFYKNFSEQWLQMPFFRTVITAILGMEFGDNLGPWAIASFAWAHPLILILLTTHAIMFCTRVPAGEVDRGTIDVFLGLPISRTRVYACESVIWLACGFFLVGMLVMGNAIGGQFAPPNMRTTDRAYTPAAANVLLLYLAIGGLAWTASALSDRRGRAIAAVLGVVLVSFLLNFLAPFQELVERISVLSVLRYYRPVFILQEGQWPWKDLVVLGSMTVTLWLLGWIAFTRRDICTT